MKKFLILSAALIVCALGIYAGLRYRNDVYLPQKELQADTEHLAEQIDRIRPSEVLDADSSARDDTGSPLAEAKALCPDVVAWVTIPDTAIDYPVVQSEDNAFYLHHSLDGTENRLGVPFLDCRCQPDFSGFNSIIYGHHSTDTRMFTQIFSFKDEGFLSQHSRGYLITDDAVRTVSFFAYLNVSNTSEIYYTTILTESDKTEYLEMLCKEAVYTEKDVQELKDKHLLLLSTCTYEFENARGILVGVIEDP